MSNRPTTSQVHVIPIEHEIVVIDDDDEIHDVETPESLKMQFPCCNCKEKIVLIVDCSGDTFTSSEIPKNQIKSFNMIKSSVIMFLKQKHNIDKKHEFALVLLKKTNTVWVSGFSSNIKTIIGHLEKATISASEDIAGKNLFDLIGKKVEVPSMEKEDVILSPPFIVRCILFYNRSHTLPVITENEAFRKLQEAPYFIFDSVLLQDPLIQPNSCKEIARRFQSLDTKGLAHSYVVGITPGAILGATTKLLGHPFQRPRQKTVK